MARRKKYYDPNQLSLFDFMVTADHIEELRREKEEDDKKSEQAEEQSEFKEETFHVRQTNSPTGNSQKNSQRNNNSGSRVHSVRHFSLLDFGQVGVEPTGRPESLGSERNVGFHSDPRQATDHRETDIDERLGVGDGQEGHERLGDFRATRDRYEVSNYQISSDDNLGVGGAKAKYADNIAAIRLLQELQKAEAQEASPDEKKILVKYVGWGGLAQAFDEKNEKWAKEYTELQSLFSEEDYIKARRSTQDAHYTSEAVIKGIYEGLSILGLQNDTNLKVLEPSAGIGNFIGLLPDDFNANFLSVELDPTTAAINQYLYPKSKIFNTGYQHSQLTKPSFDLVIGNPPFGNQSLYDPDFPELRTFSIHNYFIAKSLKLLREGGIGAFVVSRYFLDATDPKAREHISEYADFLGAIRLPGTAFKENALTDITTDIVFFQKNSGQKIRSKDWVDTGRIVCNDHKNNEERIALINKYFAQRSDCIIGEMAFVGGMYQDTVSCIVPDELKADFNLEKELSKRLEILPVNWYKPCTDETLSAEENTKKTLLNENFIASYYFKSLKLGALCVEPQSRNIVYKTRDGFGETTYKDVAVKNDTAKQRLIGMIWVRDALRELLNAEKNDDDERVIDDLRSKLNRTYDRFVSKYGHLNSQTNRSLMRDDPEHSLLESLEQDYDKGISKELAKKQNVDYRPASAKKAAIFSQRVLRPQKVAEQAENSKDALIISLRETGKVGFLRMSSLLNKSIEEVQKELQEQNLIFLNPINEEWEISDKYLTGNVREKLHIATLAAKGNPLYERNVEALTAAMPPEIEAVDIGVVFGSTWIPGQIISDFLDESIHNGNGRQNIEYVPVLGRWQAKVNIYDRAAESEIWGIPEYPASKIIETLLGNKPIKVEKESGQYDHNDKPIMVVDQELTAVAMQKGDEIRRAFNDWIWTDDDRRAELTKLYNEKFNTHVPPRYDGSHISLVNASENVSLRPHQKDVVWRSIQEGTGLFDHVVGAGKTMACIATIMESKRMGFLNKPMVVVPNHLLYSWRDEFYKLYPDANLLVADKEDFTKKNRERLFSRVATGDWDAVVVAHSSFKKVDMPQDMQKEILEEQIEAVIDAIEAAKESRGERSTIKQLEKQREKMEERYNNILAGTGVKDRAVDFGDLGIDALFVDESHEFKNLNFSTSMNVAGLGNVVGSAKALDLFIKCRYLQKKQNGRGVYFLTGTPISNSIAEVFTLQRYLQHDELQRMDIGHFDSWASIFGQITNGWELDATGVNYKLKSRFASFQNVPELLSMYRTFADVVTKNDLDEQSKKAGERPLTPPMENGKPTNYVVERSEAQAEYMGKIIDRMEHLPKDPRIDNPLKITNDARKAGLDMRLIDPNAEDFAGSKINACVDNIYRIWQESSADKGTQLVFCDLSTPKGTLKPSQAPVKRELEFDTEDSLPQENSNLSQAENANEQESVSTPKVDLSDINELKKIVENAVDSVLSESVSKVPDDTVIPLSATGELEDSNELIEAGNEDGEDNTVVKNMDEVIASMSTGTFSVYNDMRQKLIDKGIPSHEIAFIHDANTDLRKAKLFADVNRGDVRVLLGSTAKMGAGMNIQERLIAAHNLDCPWRPSDLEQRSGRIIRQGNQLYKRDPDNFQVKIYNYATKQTYDSRMWQTVEYKAAAIEQFRKGDLLQRTIEDVTSEAANAAEMKAAASGNPLILMQVQFASDLRKLEALHAQHQRSQHRMRDRLKWLISAQVRLENAEKAYKENIENRDNRTKLITEKGKTRIALRWFAGGVMLTEKDDEKIKNLLRDAVHEISKDVRQKPMIGAYRGFDISVQRTAYSAETDGFRLVLHGLRKQEYRPENCIFGFEEKFSLRGMFQRLDNFLEKGIDEHFERYKGNVKKELQELETVKSALGQEFPQKAELDLVRENHSAVMRELQRMQDDSTYVSEWTPKIMEDIVLQVANENVVVTSTQRFAM